MNGLADGRPYRTFLYVAKAGSVDGTVVAYGWYRDIVLIGAEQHGLPGQYVAELRQAPVRNDLNQRRSRRQFNIMVPCANPMNCRTIWALAGSLEIFLPEYGVNVTAFTPF